VQRGICGQIRFYAQLICEGEPYQKPGNTTINGKIGLDVGPSTIAEVNNAGASLKTFCSELEDRQREIGILQRQLDRQRRANNPGNYNPNGTIKRGIKLIWHNSHRYLHTRTRLKELNRRQREHRRSLHGAMQNALLRRGNEMYTEDVSYKSFQKNFGKSVNFRAPGAYMTGLEKKAVQLGGALIKFPTQTTALSQMCQCGRRKKKKLSQRQHQCECGISIQRDIYSAFLARHIVLQDGKYQFNLESARQEYPSLEAYLKTASN
jgi:transposase